MDSKIDVIKQHSSIFVGNLLIKMYFPYVTSYLIRKIGSEETAKRLYQIGREVGSQFLEVMPIHANNIPSMIKHLWKSMWNTTKYINVKTIKAQDKFSYQIIDRRCGICDPETPIEGLDIPCVIIDGYLEACLEALAKKLPIQSYKVQTIKSMATGDAYCEHLLIS